MSIEIPEPEPVVPAAGQEGWAHYLDPGERLLWQGAPAAGLRFRAKDALSVILGVLVLAYLFLWSGMAAMMSAIAEIGQGMGMASGVGPSLVILPLFALPFLAVGGWLVLGRPLLNAWERRHTRYALTDRRAIIARSAFGRSLRSCPIGPETPVEYRPGAEATIWLAQEERRGSRGGRHTVKHGFEFIPDGDAVYRLIRGIQDQQAGRPGA